MLLFAHVTDGTLLGQDVNWNTPNRRLASDLEITVNNPNGKKSLPMGGSNLEFAVSSKTRVQLARGRERDRSNTVSSYYVVCLLFRATAAGEVAIECGLGSDCGLGVRFQNFPPTQCVTGLYVK